MYDFLLYFCNVFIIVRSKQVMAMCEFIIIDQLLYNITRKFIVAW